MTDWTNGPLTGFNPITAMKALLQRRAARRNHKRAMSSLAQADDDTLRDLGITREEITRAIGYARTPAANTELIFLKGPRPNR